MALKYRTITQQWSSQVEIFKNIKTGKLYNNVQFVTEKNSNDDSSIQQTKQQVHLWVDFSNAVYFCPVQFSLPLQLPFPEISIIFRSVKTITSQYVNTNLYTYNFSAICISCDTPYMPVVRQAKSTYKKQHRKWMAPSKMQPSTCKICVSFSRYTHARTHARTHTHTHNRLIHQNCHNRQQCWLVPLSDCHSVTGHELSLKMKHKWQTVSLMAIYTGGKSNVADCDITTWHQNSLLDFQLEALCTAVEQFLIHLHEQLQSIVYQPVYCPTSQSTTNVNAMLNIHRSTKNRCSTLLKKCKQEAVGLNWLPSVLWCCWLGGRKGIRPVKNWVVGCWHGYMSGVRCRLFAYGPADVTASQIPIIFCLI